MNPQAPLKILIVEDDPADAELEEREIRRSGLDFTVQRVDTSEALESTLRSWQPDLVISDFSMPQLDGLSVLNTVRTILPEVPFLFVSGTIGEERAIEALKHGATDYIVKDRLGGLVIRVKRALDEARERKRLRKLEEELRQTQKMDSLGRLAGAVAHDFNNLLTAILSYGQMAIEKLQPGDSARGDVEQIYKAGESAINLTRQLLSFSRKQPLTLEPVDLNAVVGAMKPLLSRLLGNDIQIEFKADSAIKAVRANTGGLEQILLNLAVNSRDAMPNGGKLTIETSRTTRPRSSKDFGDPHPPAGATLRVADTGTGIDAETLPRIFEPFFTTKGPGGGTGLGLSTVFGIVQTFEGTVAVVSEVGRGTTFWIHLQEVAAKETRQDVAVGPPKRTTGQESILVAEDDPSILKLVAAVLRAKGYSVLEAVDGLEALRTFDAQEGKIDLLLTDAVMPGLAGRDLIARIWERKPNLAVLLMSGKVDEPAVHPTGIPQLEKPFTPSALSTLVREVLDRIEKPIPKPKWKILAIDDEPDITDWLEATLQPDGYEVFAINKPEKALAEAEKVLPDLILLDFEMPKLTGPDVASLLKANPKTKGIPIVYLSSMTEADPQVIGFLSGAVGYLGKPIEPDRLLEALRAFIPAGKES